MEGDLRVLFFVFLHFPEGKNIQHAAGESNFDLPVLILYLPDAQGKFLKLLKEGKARVVKIGSAFGWAHSIGGAFEQAGAQFLFQMTDHPAEPLRSNKQLFCRLIDASGFINLAEKS